MTITKVQKILLIVGVAVSVLSAGVISYFLYKRSAVDRAVQLELVSVEDGSIADNKKDSLIFVDVSGAVHSPGVYKFQDAARIYDALVQAGGILPDASAMWVSQNINLSTPIKDGDKVYIPYAWEVEKSSDIVLIEPEKLTTNIVSTKPDDTKDTSKDRDTPSTDSGDSELLNINTASSEELDELPGVGPVYADKIISNRPYSTSEGLVTKAGLSESVVSKFKNMIKFK